MGGKKPLRRPLWPPTRATASNYYPLGLDGAGGAAKPLLRAPKKPAPLHGRLPAFSGAVDAFERARKCFLEWRYFFSIILSEFLKNRVALHRELKLEKLWAIFRDNAAFIAGTMFVMAPSKATGQVFAYLNITKIIANFMFSISTNPYIVLCMIFVIMFIVGMFVQTTPAIVILAPTLLAVVSQVGIDPIHFGIIMTLALAIAFVTPPVALNLFVGSSMTGLSIDKIVRAFMPFLIGLIVAFFIVSFVPAISLGVLGDWSLTFG